MASSPLNRRNVFVEFDCLLLREWYLSGDEPTGRGMVSNHTVLTDWTCNSSSQRPPIAGQIHLTRNNCNMLISALKCVRIVGDTTYGSLITPASYRSSPTCEGTRPGADMPRPVFSSRHVCVERSRTLLAPIIVSCPRTSTNAIVHILL